MCAVVSLAGCLQIVGTEWWGQASRVNSAASGFPTERMPSTRNYTKPKRLKLGREKVKGVVEPPPKISLTSFNIKARS